MAAQLGDVLSRLRTLEGAGQLSTSSLLDQLEAKNVAARADAKRVIRKWALTLLGAMGVPVALLFGFSDLVNLDVVQATLISKSAAISKAVEQNAARLKRADSNMRILAGLMLEVRDEQVDSTLLLGEKIDTVHKRARQVTGASLRAGSTHRESRDIRVKELFGPPVN